MTRRHLCCCFLTSLDKEVHRDDIRYGLGANFGRAAGDGPRTRHRGGPRVAAPRRWDSWSSSHCSSSSASRSRFMTGCRKRDVEAVHLQAQISAALRRDARLAGLVLTPTARILAWGSRGAIVQISGEVPDWATPYGPVRRARRSRPAAVGAALARALQVRPRTLGFRRRTVRIGPRVSTLCRRKNKEGELHGQADRLRRRR